jgi:glycosyltransferase involved in cell wall biosynthesis
MTKQKNIIEGTGEILANFFDYLAVDTPDIIVFSHLRWDFVFQRPQHIITRLAKDRKILFVEEPIPFTKENKNTVRIINAERNIVRLQPRITFEDFTQKLPSLVDQQTKLLGFKNPMLWFYSAAFSEIIPLLNSSLVVYDCMDELSLFKGASPTLIAQEKYLLAKADVVFTGGKSLYEEKKKYAENVFCFPSSVDQKHFAKADDTKTAVPSDIKKISRPTVGFYGVVDERFDTALLADVAKRMPAVSFVVIGPVVKIEEKDLPHLSNIHYLGPKSYEELPAYLSALDVAMMPFALNDATKFISPTKTLEFMAAGKPIVSTPITDVVRDYKDIIRIAATPEDFATAINSFLNESSEQLQKRQNLYKTVLAQTSWDSTVKHMKQIMKDRLIVKTYAAQEIDPSFYALPSQVATGK